MDWTSTTSYDVTQQILNLADAVKTLSEAEFSIDGVLRTRVKRERIRLLGVMQQLCEEAFPTTIKK